MKYGILGTGNVAQEIGSKLIQLGHEVKLGTRDPKNEKALNWAKKNGSKASVGTFAETVSFSDRIFNCVKGIHAIEVITSVGPEKFKNKILIDLTNPYNYKDGHISLDPKYSGNTSLGEEIQKLQDRWGKDYVYDSDLNKEGKYCCDCSGLISSLVGGQNTKNSYWFRNNAIESKPIEERKDNMKGWAVYKPGHIGVYDGNNGYYAMDGSERNMVHNKLSENNFTEIIKLSDINYD